MLVYSSDGEPFTTGRVPYLDQIQGRHGTNICIAVRFADLAPTTVVVDTATPWCILSNPQARAIDSAYRETAIQETRLSTRLGDIDGVLVRWPIRLIAEEGQDIEIDGTVFIPDDDVQLPNFIGLEGLLSRIRFAVDPANNFFFFGAM